MGPGTSLIFMKGVSLLIRGTCQEFRFKLPYLLSQVAKVRITFWQEENDGTQQCSLPITKEIIDPTSDVDSKTLSVTLNQVETLAFTTDKRAFVQFKGLTKDNFAFGCRPKPITVYPVKDDTILE